MSQFVTDQVCVRLLLKFGLRKLLVKVMSTVNVSIIAVFEPGRDSATLSRSLFECRTKINHPRHQVANKYQMSHI